MHVETISAAAQENDQAVSEAEVSVRSMCQKVTQLGDKVRMFKV
jgi:methyl-accepting chemotaxis protein/methyl-accepting chemotaxis protein-2 (aspartate sensor receptor)